MRDGWVKTTLGAVALLNPSEPPLRDTDHFVPMDAVHTGKRWIEYTEEKRDRNGARARQGDVLFARITPCLENGKVAQVQSEIERCGGSTEFIVIRGTEKCLSDFLYFWCTLNSNREKAAKLMTGTTGRQRLSRQDLASLDFFLPPIFEQKRIVDLISSVDSYIEALQQQLENTKRSRNAVLHEFMNGESTAMEKTQLGKIAEFLNGKAYSKEELLAVGKYRVLRVGNFFSNNNWYRSDLELEPNKYCENGDLLYAWSASFGPRIWKEEKVIYHYHIWKVNPDESQVNKKWLFYWLEDDVERIKSASGSGSIMMHVTKSEMEKRAIGLPTLSEQSRQLVTLEGFDQSIHTLETSIASTNQLRTSMLSDLLSGGHEIPSSYDKLMGVA